VTGPGAAPAFPSKDLLEIIELGLLESDGHETIAGLLK
jgi:hypothetical protein